MSPKGSFAVDWGDGTIDNIDRDNTTATDYSHTYTNGGVKTIKFCGRATEYNTAGGDNVVAAISFHKSDADNTSKWIASISGALGSVFQPYLIHRRVNPVSAALSKVRPT